MRTTSRWISYFCLAAALSAPVVVIAIPQPQASVQVRVYDRTHKDYHSWDDRENTAWNLYLSENHKHQHEYKKASRKEQDNYWTWRHAHPDNDDGRR
jgi:hypothetical protein